MTPHTVKRPRHILLTKVQIPLRHGLILHGNFHHSHVAVKNMMWLLKLTMQNESVPEEYLHFSEQDVMLWSFYRAPHRLSANYIVNLLTLLT